MERSIPGDGQGAGRRVRVAPARDPSRGRLGYRPRTSGRSPNGAWITSAGTDGAAPVRSGVAEGHVDDATSGAFAATVEDATVVGVTLLVTHYVATALFLDALEDPLAEEFVGWHPGGA